MSGDPRPEAVAERLANGNWYPSEFEGSGRAAAQWCDRAADAVLESADEADKAAGIYRVSLDAAVEAAAEAAYREANPDYAHGWPFEPEAQRGIYRERVRPLVTAAVMGGAQ